MEQQSQERPRPNPAWRQSDSSNTAAEDVELQRADPLGHEAKTESTNADGTWWDWDNDPNNPYNWTTGAKARQIIMLSVSAFVSSMGTSIISSSTPQLMKEFDVSNTVALLPLSFYVFALGLGPVVGGPLSETIGRYPVYLISPILAGLFTVGAALVHNFAGLVILRFLAGLCFSPPLSISSGTIAETFIPEKRGIPAIIFVLMPFLGPGIGPVIGSFVTNRKGWRWTQWTLAIGAVLTFLAALLGTETFHPILKRRRAKQLGRPLPDQAPILARMQEFASISIFRPLHMLFTEPIVGLVCLYVACEFATLFSFFAAVPYVYRKVYGFGIESIGLIFLAIVVGCLLGSVILLLCNALLYMPKTKNYPANKTPGEYRLYAAMVGSLWLPVSLFWFGWSAKESVSWVSSTFAIVFFAMGNLCLFVSTVTYLGDCYHGTVVASAISANSFARYLLAGVFPLFTIQMYTNVGIGGASSILGGIALLLLPVPWAFFKYGPAIRARSKYETGDHL